ncbi:hypothetical protein M408DRAFT_333633 [Serendipita vermifera MAFF 305830]|uniref:F-box domain-containing protein n=1 Tax=Serendipita vermifera MAFF 305830 TaxID=933852 RepID=A0A0C2WUV1_SERVB|nr:hypothetical protein M408DRAFT_333633 [Serendipita vermifera MAFF 305830]
MSLCIPESSLRPILGRNRNPFPYEEAFLEENRILSAKLITQSEEELDVWTIRAQKATIGLNQKATNRAAAELRLKATQDMRNAFSDSKLTISSPVLEIHRRYEELQASCIVEMEPNLRGIADVLDRWESGQYWISDQIQKANDALVEADKAVVQSLEAQQEALAREEQCLAMVQAIKNYIHEIKHINGTRMHRSIWRVPETIWREIFAVVIDDNCKIWGASSFTSNLNPRYPSLTISAVCQLWRSIAQTHQYLWRTIQSTVEEGPSTNKRRKRTRAYLRLSGSQPLQIVLEVPSRPTPVSGDLLAEIVSGSNTVSHLIIRGGTTGPEVLAFIAKKVKSPSNLTIAIMDKHPFQSLYSMHSTMQNVKQLTLVNCGPLKFFRRSNYMWSSNVVKLNIFNFKESLTWPFFRDWIPFQSSQLKHLELATKWKNTQLDTVVESTSFKCLEYMRTRLRTLILFYQSTIYTPALRSLTVISSKNVDMEAWKAFATDSQGGGSITKVTIENDKDANWASLSTYLHQLPKLQILEIMGDAVRPLLHSLVEFSEGEEKNEDEVLLKKLKVLSIDDYQDEGTEIFSFASKYLPVHGNISSGDEGYGSVLRVSLQNCPNISGHVMQMMEDAGLFSSEGSNSPSPAASEHPVPISSQTPVLEPTA